MEQKKDIGSQKTIHEEDIYNELGFNKAAPTSTRESFLKFLKRQTKDQPLTPREKRKIIQEQLFLPGLEDQICEKKRAS